MKNPCGMKNLSERAMTLIELLVVFVVIGVLMLILVPVFRGMQASAKTAQCVNNLRQIGMTFYLYADDNKETFPRGGGGSPSYFFQDYDSDSSWENRLYPYTDDKDIFRCSVMMTGMTIKDITMYGGSESNPVTWVIRIAEISGRYGYNGFIGGGVGRYNARAMTVPDIKRPSETILCVDAITSKNLSSLTCWQGPKIDYRHSNGANILFVSGNAKWCSQKVIEENTGVGTDDRQGGWWGWYYDGRSVY